MKKVTAKRGVCIGPDRHLVPGETADLDDGTADYLRNIGAVELAPAEPVSDLLAEEPIESKSTPAKAGRKEK